ncbi:MAG TPA: glycosyltransferase family 1 protein [Bacteroidia bacterium]|nr:glycosyltransferase family 1 protein [Bacteroidia bacterium]
MLIAVNTRFLLKNKLEGIGRFTDETLKVLTAKYPEHKFLFIFDRKFDGSFIYNSNIMPVVIPPQTRHPVLLYLWFEWSITYILKKYKPDVFLSTDGFLSLRTNVPQLPVMHDLAFIHRPDDISGLVKKYYNYYFPRFARKAARIATVSEFSKQDIVDNYQINPSNIDVVYNGVSDIFKPISEEQKIATRLRITGGKPYFVFVGALQPRKNITNLLKAFDDFKKSDTQSAQLVIVGRKAWQTEEMDTVYNSLVYKSDVVFTGRLSDEDLSATIAASLAMVYVAFFEGFGLPLAEAFKCHVPVITSDVSSMPEVAGDAGILTDPHSVENIAQALRQMAGDSALRQQLVNRAVERSQLFTWEKTATLLWQSIEKTTNHAP